MLVQTRPYILTYSKILYVLLAINVKLTAVYATLWNITQALYIRTMLYRSAQCGTKTPHCTVNAELIEVYHYIYKAEHSKPTTCTNTDINILLLGYILGILYNHKTLSESSRGPHNKYIFNQTIDVYIKRELNKNIEIMHIIINMIESIAITQ